MGEEALHSYLLLLEPTYLSIYLSMNDTKMMKIIMLQVINNTPCYRDCWDLIHWTEDIQPLKWRGWLHMTRHRPLDHHNPCHQEPVHSHCITLQVFIKYTIRSNEMTWVDCSLNLVGDQYCIQASSQSILNLFFIFISLVSCSCFLLLVKCSTDETQKQSQTIDDAVFIGHNCTLNYLGCDVVGGAAGRV